MIWFKRLLCKILGHKDDGRGDMLSKCPRCGFWTRSR